MIWVEILGSLLGSLSLLALGFFVWKNAVARQEIVFFCLFCLLYVLFTVLSLIQDGLPLYIIPHLNTASALLQAEAIGNWVSYFALIVGVFAVGCLFEFIQRFPDNRQLWPSWMTRLVWVGFAVFLCFGVFAVWPVGPYEAFYVVPPFFVWYSLFLVVVFGMIWTNFTWKAYRLRAERPGLMVIVVGLGIFMLGILIGNVVIPTFNVFTWCWVGRLLATVFAFSVFVSVTSYKTFRIRTAVHYTFYWLCSTSVFALVLLGILYFLYQLFLENRVPTFGVWILLAIGIAVLVRLHLAWVQPRLNAVFFRRRIALKEQVVYFQKTLSTLTTLPSFITAAHRFLTDSLMVRGVAILVATQGRPLLFIDGAPALRHDGFDDVTYHADAIPSFLARLSECGMPFETAHLLCSQGECFGILCLGEKRNLKPLDSEDYRFLEIVIPSLSVYLKNATLYDALQSKRNEVVSLQQHLVALQAGVSSGIEGQVLTTGVLHEVKNTHLAMGGLINQILEKEITDPALVDEILRSIGLQSEYLYLFSKNLLYTHQMDIQAHFDPQKRQLSHVMTAVQEAMKPHTLLIRSSKLSVRLDISDSAILLILANPFHLLLSNLVHNAAKHGGAALHIGFVQTDAESQFVFTSSGFSRPVNPAVKVGVGLTICRQIVAFHGGKLQIETAVDTFVVRVVL